MTVPVLERNYDGSWLHVYYLGYDGWIDAISVRPIPNLLDIPAVFAGLLTVIVIGLIVENLIFRTIERNTVLKWGLQS